MDPIRIVILGNPASYQKKTFNWQAKDGRSGTGSYDVKSYANWRSAARGAAADQFAAQCGSKPPIEDAVTIRVAVYRQIPTSMSAKKQRLAVQGHIRPILKPDLSNYLKAIEDACLTGIVIRDDRMVVEAHLLKFYSDKPRVEIVVSLWAPDGYSPSPSLFVESRNA